MTPRVVRSSSRPPGPHLARALLTATGAALTLVLAACSSAEPSSTTSPDTAVQDDAQGGSAPDGAPQAGEGRAPGVSGLVAAVDGTTAQVQDGDSQTAVSWSDSTTITVTDDGSLADVAVDSCVMAIVGGMPGDEGAEDAAEGSTATTVAVSEPVDGECAAGFGGGFPGGMRPGGEMPGDGELPEGVPTDMPTDMPTGAPDGGFEGFGGATVGLVTAIDGSTLTVSTTSSDGESTEETVTVDDATTYTVQRDGAATDVVVGQCVSAQGESDDSGTLAATTLSLSAAGDDGCTLGRGGFPGGQGGAGPDGDGDA